MSPSSEQLTISHGGTPLVTINYNPETCAIDPPVIDLLKPEGDDPPSFRNKGAIAVDGTSMVFLPAGAGYRPKVGEKVGCTITNPNPPPATQSWDATITALEIADDVVIGKIPYTAIKLTLDTPAAFGIPDNTKFYKIIDLPPE